MIGDLARLHILISTLQLAVFMRIHRYKASGGPTAEDQTRSLQAARSLQGHAHTLLRGSDSEGEVAGMFNKLADALAVAAFTPGGVDFLGQHWEETRHDHD